MWVALVVGGLLSVIAVTTGNVMTIQADGVSYTVSADRMTFHDGEFQMEGNVRLRVGTP